MTVVPSLQQVAAIEKRGNVFVSAGAGTGKTTVLVERFVSAVVQEGVDVESLLVITYTERAASELRDRIRTRFFDLGETESAQVLDSAWISTIHGFCSRVLRSYSVAAGIDPSFHVLDENQAKVLRSESFLQSLEHFCGREEPERVSLLATYGSTALRSILVPVYEKLRSAGLPLDLGIGPLVDFEDLRSRVDDLLATDPESP